MVTPTLGLERRSSASQSRSLWHCRSKSLGTAVERNRYKRQVREAVRLVYDQIRPGWDVIFIVRAGFRTAAWEQIQQAVSRLLQQAQLWHDREQPSQEDRHG